MTRVFGVWPVVVLFALSSSAFASPTVATNPKVVFHATGSPGFLTFDGVTKQITVVDDGTNLVFTVPLATIETGIALRDQHMRERYVETDKFPNAVLTFPRAAVLWPEVGAESTGTLQAPFEAHGVQQTVTVTYSLKGTATGYKIKATFPFNTSSHGIAIPSYLGVTIAPDMKAEVAFEIIGR